MSFKKTQIGSEILQTLSGLFIGNKNVMKSYLYSLCRLRKLKLTFYSKLVEGIASRISELKALWSLKLRSIDEFDRPATLELGSLITHHELLEVYLVGPLTRSIESLCSPNLRVLTLATITEARIQNFVQKNIICRFRIPLTIISDNGRQFDSQGFKDFCSSLGIKNQYSSPGHPQVNGQMEVTNRTLLKIIKTKLDEAKGAQLDELPNVLWAYRTTARTPTGETPFRLTYGTEAVIPVEVGVASTRRTTFSKEENDDKLRVNLDSLDKVREKASSKMTEYQ